MSRFAVIAGCFLFSCLLWSCEGSFGTNNPTGTQQTPNDPNWFSQTITPVTIANGRVTLPPSAPQTLAIMIAWEHGLATDPPKFYFYGTDSLVSSSGGGYTFSISLPSKLPINAVRRDSASNTAVAVGHVFLVDTTVIRSGMIMDTMTFNKSNAVYGTVTYNNDTHDNHLELLTVFYRYGSVETPGVFSQGNPQNDSLMNGESYNQNYNLFMVDQVFGLSLRAPGDAVLLYNNLIAYDLVLWKPF